MKKLFTFAAAAIMIAALSATAMAASYGEGDIIYKDGDDYEEAGGSLIPGKEYYVVICEYDKDKDKDNKPSSIKWDKIEVNDPNEDETLEGSKAKKYATLSSGATKIKIGSGDYVWGAKLEVKAVKASNYDDSIDVEGNITYRLGSHDEDFDRDFSIEYEDGGNEFEEDEMMYEFDRNDDVEIDFPDGDGRLVGVANKDFKLIASMNTDYNSTIGNKYPNANLDFYNGNGVSLTYIKNAKLHFEAGSDHYLYEITDGNKLVDLSSTYDKGKGEFIVSARSLGKFVVSNRKLDASSSASGSNTAGSSSSSTSSGNTSGGNTSSGSTSLDGLYSLINRNFSNKFTLLSYGTTYEVMPKAQNFLVSVNLSGMNTNDLYLYTYDAANNRLIGSANKPKVGADGKLSFVTNTKGYYVISSGQLSK